MYLLTETVSPFALERWAAFFANFGQFAKGFITRSFVALLVFMSKSSKTHHCLSNSWSSSMGFQS